MRKLLFTLGTLLLFSCGSSRLVTQNTPPPPSGPDGVKIQVGEVSSINEAPLETLFFTSESRIGEMMNFLASDDLKGRDSGSEGIEMAAKYAENYFRSYGLAPYYESFRDTLANYKKTSYNIVGMVEGSDPDLKNEYILIGAHYDHIGIIKAENGDAIANGANDNASGTSTVLELARYFGTKKTNRRSLIFALFSAEEKGLLGSKHMARNMKENNLNLYAMLNFEMTGVPLKGRDYLIYITGYEKSNLAEVSNKYADENLVGFLRTAKDYNLFQRSDNYPFHTEFGVPSHTFCTFDFTNFDYYHRVGDESDIMDFDHMANVVNKLIPVLEGIANSPEKEVKVN
ncbi:M28 family metallopeptidase [Flagellimonas allohymeniacidonis]|uniref:M20/M25/M40 family metallo-hydrolase n=1 Tax=Flagellimonas allohymeniacidonis TaxID=2517819 RepID=A0A4Q8QGV3_9FLAO|nr:M28 family peptidase [Allomuricauda hymeniacidonis]TAI49731.1 M20/M25/M40 family metallo-hydrolase [Allomuricauda hymeniacidonis]